METHFISIVFSHEKCQLDDKTKNHAENVHFVIFSKLVVEFVQYGSLSQKIDFLARTWVSENKIGKSKNFAYFSDIPSFESLVFKISSLN